MIKKKINDPFYSNLLNDIKLNKVCLSIPNKKKTLEENIKRESYFENTCDQKYIDSNWENVIINDDNSEQINEIKKWIKEFKIG